MAAPSGTILRPDLGQAFEAIDLAAARQEFVGLQVAPVFPVALQAANFSKVRAQDLLQRRETLRAPGDGYARASWTVVRDHYATSEYGAEEELDRRERNMYAFTGVQQELIAAERARDVVLREQELRLASLLLSTTETDSEGNTMGTSAVSNAWTDKTNGTPIADINTAINAFRDQCGMSPNVLVMNDVLMRAFKLSDEVTDILKFSGFDDPKAIGPATIRAYFAESGIERVLVASARYNSAKEGQTASFSKVWSTDKVGLYRVDSGMDLRGRPSVARTFFYTGDGASPGGTIEMYPWEPNRSDIVRCRIDVDEKLLLATLGYILTGTNGGTP